MKKINDGLYLIVESNEDPCQNVYLFLETGMVTNKNLQKITLLESNDVLVDFVCPCLPLDIETGNGRIYPTEVVRTSLVEAVPFFKDKSLRCSANDHPDEVKPVPTDTSHHVTNAYMKDGHLHIEARIAPTQKGRDLLGLIREGYPLGISVRGTGGLDRTGRYVNSYTFLGADFVSNPSTGLHVYPEFKAETTLESKEPTITNELDNNLTLQENQKVIQTMTNNISIDELRSVLTESSKKLKNAKSTSDKQTIITVTESTLARYNTLTNTDTMGIQEVIGLVREWLELKEEELSDETPVIEHVAEDTQKIYQNENPGVRAAVKESSNEQLQKNLLEAKNHIKILNDKNKSLKESYTSMHNSYKNFRKNVKLHIDRLNEKYVTESKEKLKNRRTLINSLIESKTRSIELEKNKLLEELKQSKQIVNTLKQNLVKKEKINEALVEDNAATKLSLEILADFYHNQEK